MPRPRKPLADLSVDEIPDALEVATYELNALLKVAGAEDIPTHVDIIDRGTHVEVKVQVPE